ncbi:ATP-binding protein [Actinophytocola sp.]|uniref:ATP-binding protein n=1 Tax=Actinophytocola sp. TaxID=1872138 RepID=UPI003D6C45B3
MTDVPRAGGADLNRLLGEARLASADAAFLSQLRRRLETPLRGCTSGAVREATVVVGELLTNAFHHAQAPYTIRLILPAPGHVVRLEVHDATPSTGAGWPLGCGLRLVRRLCPDWSVQHAAAGKAGWADLPVLVTPVDG